MPLQVTLLPISAKERMNSGNMLWKISVEKLYTHIKLSNETLREEVQSVDLETDESEFQDESHAYASFGNLG